MCVLNSAAYHGIVSWSSDGKSFVFVDSNAFERVVLPSIFKVAKFDSFLRKVSASAIAIASAKRAGCRYDVYLT